MAILPAITLVRSLFEIFAGIRSGDVPAFGGAQLVGAFSALLLLRSLFNLRDSEPLPQEAAPN